ncbi:hypothetical protein NLX83_06510 [Allokutzneria sp. A3M-2-11 16]|uniref:hypothetical protein n=1 Tax=Allokutzneria sp. A3M-2-11 16 TaxID=2962043 RepID=UPI0020B83845|nr:hypothetical protein [Allokutzneria sp. A3M-2-11 16]MCP3798906.1 hypothetical protein [Allokutzneria sp. A3M-2-11 16]
MDDKQPPRVVLWTTAGLAAAAVLAAAWFGVGWLWLSGDESVEFAKEREAVSTAGQQAIVNFNTLDYRNFDAMIARWQEVSTGALQADFVADKDRARKELEQLKQVSTAKVLDAAVTSLDTRAGKATVMSVVERMVSLDGQPAEPLRFRFLAELTKTDTGWKLNALAPIKVAGGAS